jgi:rRNA methylases
LATLATMRILPWLTWMAKRYTTKEGAPVTDDPNKKKKTQKNIIVMHSSSKDDDAITTNNQKILTQQDHGTRTIRDSPTLENRILPKAEGALRLRTSRLVIVVERCTNDHNYSAIMRSAEALGVQHVYIIAPQDCNTTLKIDGQVGLDFETLDEASDAVADVGNKKLVLHRSNGIRVKGYTEAEEVKDRANHHLFAQRALEWLDVTEFNTTRECIDSLRKDGYQIWSTDLSQVAVTLDENGLGERDGHEDVCCCCGRSGSSSIIPEKLAIVFGTEAVGCSTQMLEASDKRVYLPLRGFADSLNLSVATALVVHQLFLLDPTLIGAMSEEERMQLRRKWYAKLATQRIMTKSEKAKKR